jgi:hypothetical protein
MFFLVVTLAAIAALLVVFGVMDLRARRRGQRYRLEEAREQPSPFDADLARMRSRFQNGTGPGF